MAAKDQLIGMVNVRKYDNIADESGVHVANEMVWAKFHVQDGLWHILETVGDTSGSVSDAGSQCGISLMESRVVPEESCRLFQQRTVDLSLIGDCLEATYGDWETIAELANEICGNSRRSDSGDVLQKCPAHIFIFDYFDILNQLHLWEIIYSNATLQGVPEPTRPFFQYVSSAVNDSQMEMMAKKNTVINIQDKQWKEPVRRWLYDNLTDKPSFEIDDPVPPIRPKKGG